MKYDNDEQIYLPLEIFVCYMKRLKLLDCQLLALLDAQ